MGVGFPMALMESIFRLCKTLLPNGPPPKPKKKKKSKKNTDSEWDLENNNEKLHAHVLCPCLLHNTHIDC